MEDAIGVEIASQTLGGEGFVELDFAGIDSLVTVFDDRLQLSFDVG